MENSKVVVEMVDGQINTTIEGPPLVTLGMLEVAMATAMQRFGITHTGSQPAKPTSDEAAGD